MADLRELLSGPDNGSFSGAMSQAQLPDNPILRAARGLQGLMSPIANVSGGAPVQAEDFLPSIPTSKRDALLQALMLAGPVVGQAAWKSRGLPKAMIDALSKEEGPLMSRINKRNTVFHATSPEGANDIMDSGRILSGDSADSGIPGVSVSRVPRVASKLERAVSFVLDPTHPDMPKSRPITEGGDYQKTVPKFQPNQTFEEFKQALMPGAPREHNPLFEFENRTFGKDVPLSTAKEMWIDRSELWPSEVEKLTKKAASQGIPTRVFGDGRQMHQARARLK